MCGLIGAAGNIGFQEKKAIRTLLILDAIRGEHSTGIGIVNTGGKMALAKEVDDPFSLFRTDDFTKLFDNNMNMKVVIGHNRFATMGAKTAENAHPFISGNVIGAHNGTLEKRYLHRLDDVEKFEVDSEAIFHNINKNGFEETISRLNGAWALTYYDADDEEMHFTRNTQRPLFYCYSKDLNTMFWSSMSWALEVALDKAGIDSTLIEPFDPFCHYHIDLSGNGMIKKRDLYCSQPKYVGYTPPKVIYSVPKEEKKATNGVMGNITNLFKGQPSKGVDPAVMFMQGLIGKSVEFYVDSEKRDAQDVPYLLCRTTTGSNSTEIRLYGQSNHRWKEWVKSTGVYTGRMKKVIDRWEPKLHRMEQYILPDLRTISEEKPIDGIPTYPGAMDAIPFEEPQQRKAEVGDIQWALVETFKGYGGKPLGYLEFLNATKNGCMDCGEDAENLHSPSSLIFVDEKHFICPDCQIEHKRLTGIA